MLICTNEDVLCKLLPHTYIQNMEFYIEEKFPSAFTMQKENPPPGPEASRYRSSQDSLMHVFASYHL